MHGIAQLAPQSHDAFHPTRVRSRGHELGLQLPELSLRLSPKQLSEAFSSGGSDLLLQSSFCLAPEQLSEASPPFRTGNRRGNFFRACGSFTKCISTPHFENFF